MRDLAGLALIAALVGCASFPPDPEDQHAATPSLEADQESIERTVIIFMQATNEEIQAKRDEFEDEDDFYVMTDDLMWYRAEARRFLEEEEFAEILYRERGPLTFKVDGQVRTYDFDEHTTLDLIVGYRKGVEPMAVAPNEAHQLADYFGDPP